MCSALAGKFVLEMGVVGVKITARKTRMSKYTAKTLHSKTYYSSGKIKKLIIKKFESIEEVITYVSDDFLD